MNSIMRRCILPILIVAPFQMAAALEVPPLQGRVNDLANIIDPSTESSLKALLSAHEQATTNQVAVLTIPSLEGDVIEEFSMRVAMGWKLGKKNSDNGVLLLVARDDRKLRIEVGYGLEGVLTDLDTSRIIREIMVPKLRAGSPALAVSAGVNAIVNKLAPGQATGTEEPYDAPAAESEDLTLEDIGILFVFLVAMILRGILGGGGRRRGGVRGGFYSSGRSYSSGSSFGGGGGSFGGGGSSGSW